MWVGWLLFFPSWSFLYFVFVFFVGVLNVDFFSFFIVFLETKEWGGRVGKCGW